MKTSTEWQLHVSFFNLVCIANTTEKHLESSVHLLVMEKEIYIETDELMFFERNYNYKGNILILIMNLTHFGLVIIQNLAHFAIEF